MSSLKLTAPSRDAERDIMRMRTAEIEARAAAEAAPSQFLARMWLIHANNCARIVRELGR